MTIEEFKKEYEGLSEEEKNLVCSLQQSKNDMQSISLKTINDMIIYHKKMIADCLFQIDAGLWYAKEALELRKKDNGIHKESSKM